MDFMNSAAKGDTGVMRKLRATAARSAGLIWCRQEVVMKLANAKSMLVKAVTVSLLAVGVAITAPAKANAAVVVDAGFGAHYYGRPDYHERLRIEEARRHAEWVRAHERDRSYYGYRR
jgi:hypothetical protein